jgi:hypothetical protein
MIYAATGSKFRQENASNLRCISIQVDSPIAMPKDASFFDKSCAASPPYLRTLNCMKNYGTKCACIRFVNVSVVIAALWFGNVGKVDAVPSPEQHEMSGTVQRVDHDTINVVTAHASKLEVFSWTKDTKFIRDGVVTTADTLRVGNSVQIRCSHPIIGSKPRLYRVVWQTNGTKKGK